MSPENSGHDNRTVEFRGKIFRIVHVPLPDGGYIEIAERAPGTRTIIIDRGKRQILMTEEKRSEMGGRTDLRLPGGKVFDTLDEYEGAITAGVDIEEAARSGAVKEMREETGYDIVNPKLFHVDVVGATVKWDLYYFIAEEFEHRPGGQELEYGEDIQTRWVSFDDARKMCQMGEMGESRSVGVLLRVLSLPEYQ